MADWREYLRIPLSEVTLRQLTAIRFCGGTDMIREGDSEGIWRIPEGNTACVNFSAIQRDPRNFSTFPNTFWPDRWFVAKGLVKCPVSNRTGRLSLYIFYPGPAGCVVKPLALLGESYVPMCPRARLTMHQ